MKTRRIVISLLFAFIVNGCDIFDSFPGSQPYPSETIAELIAHKTSMTIFTPEYPESVELEFRAHETNPAIYSGQLHLIFTPSADEFRQHYEGDYYYSFSKESASNFELLGNFRFSNGEDPDTIYIECFSGEVDENLKGIPDIAERYVDGNVFIIPVDATHVELRFLPNTSNEFELVQRVALDNLYAWRKYIQPFIQNYQ